MRGNILFFFFSTSTWIVTGVQRYRDSCEIHLLSHIINSYRTSKAIAGIYFQRRTTGTWNSAQIAYLATFFYSRSTSASLSNDSVNPNQGIFRPTLTKNCIFHKPTYIIGSIYVGDILYAPHNRFCSWNRGSKCIVYMYVYNIIYIYTYE